MELSRALSGLSPQKFFLEKFLILFSEKPALKKSLIFSQKKPPIFQETELSYTLERVYSDPWQI